MKNDNFLFYGLLFLVLLIFLILGTGSNKPARNEVCFKENCFDVELAKTPGEKSQGLMFRQDLDPDKGMLFIFSTEDKYPFWMKNMLIPLDIIWINKDKEVVWIAQDVQPCTETCDSIIPEKEAMYVLELNSGTAEKIGLELGDKLYFNF